MKNDIGSLARFLSMITTIFVKLEITTRCPNLGHFGIENFIANYFISEFYQFGTDCGKFVSGFIFFFLFLKFVNSAFLVRNLMCGSILVDISFNVLSFLLLRQ